jgi:hypothetical protein
MTALRAMISLCFMTSLRSMTRFAQEQQTQGAVFVLSLTPSVMARSAVIEAQQSHSAQRSH